MLNVEANGELEESRSEIPIKIFFFGIKGSIYRLDRMEHGSLSFRNIIVGLYFYIVREAVRGIIKAIRYFI